MSAPTVPLQGVATLFLARQHLDRPRALPLTPGRLTRFVEDAGGLQIDSINVLERAHYLTLWSRFGPYDRARLDRLVYRRRLLFEYWAHAACLVPISMLPWWRRAMLDYRLRHTGWSRWLKRNARVLAMVTEAIRANGPLGSADFESRRPGARAGWWNWRPVQHALDYLWMNGALTVHSRQHFHKRFDLLERAFPAVLTVEPGHGRRVPGVARRAIAARHGSGHRDGSQRISHLPALRAGGRRAPLAKLRDAGVVTELEVEGSRGRWLALTRDLPTLARAARQPAPSRGTTLLSPFDSLLWHRDRVARLFGFDYRIEVYTPGHRRVHGYYTLPILHDGQLIGRVDAKTHRAERRLEVRNVHFEPWFVAGEAPPGGWAVAKRTGLDRDEAVIGVAEALRSLAGFVRADAIVLRRVVPHRLRAPLARALRPASTPQPF